MLRVFVLNIYKRFLNRRLSLKSLVIFFGYIFLKINKSRFVLYAPNSCEVFQLKLFTTYSYLFQVQNR